VKMESSAVIDIFWDQGCSYCAWTECPLQCVKVVKKFLAHHGCIALLCISYRMIYTNFDICLLFRSLKCLLWPLLY
jgi:hypothetical protein